MGLKEPHATNTNGVLPLSLKHFFNLWVGNSYPSSSSVVELPASAVWGAPESAASWGACAMGV